MPRKKGEWNHKNASPTGEKLLASFGTQGIPRFATFGGHLTAFHSKEKVVKNTKGQPSTKSSKWWFSFCTKAYSKPSTPQYNSVPMSKRRPIFVTRYSSPFVGTHVARVRVKGGRQLFLTMMPWEGTPPGDLEKHELCCLPFLSLPGN